MLTYTHIDEKKKTVYKGFSTVPYKSLGAHQGLVRVLIDGEADFWLVEPFLVPHSLDFYKESIKEIRRMYTDTGENVNIQSIQLFKAI